MHKGITHIAVAVGNLDRACAFWHDVMGAEIEGRTVVPAQKAEVAFVKLGDGARLELLAPTDDDSPVARFLAKNGPGMHHICLAVDDIAAHLEHLADHGIKLIDREPRPGAEGHRIAFLHPSSTLGTLIELSESPETKG